MKEEFVDIWQRYDEGEVVCIPTNGFVKKNGEAVMGRGVAKQAAQRWPDLPGHLGDMLGIYGNWVLVLPPPRLLAFPVKPEGGISDGANVVSHMSYRYTKGFAVPGWALVADLPLITRSLSQLDAIRRQYGWEHVYLPRPGCGAGELDWETQVRPLCAEYGDWLIVVDRPEEA